MQKLFRHLFWNLNLDLFVGTLQRFFYELPVIKDPKAKKLATLVLMNEFDYIIQEAREIFDFYGMNREKSVIEEILIIVIMRWDICLGIIKSLMGILKGKSLF